MAVTYFDYASSLTDGGSFGDPGQYVVSITPPASMQQGDLCILFATARISVTPRVVYLNNTGGQSWNTVALSPNAASSLILNMWWCTFNGTWTSDPIITYSFPGHGMLSSGVTTGNLNGATNVPRQAQMFVFRPTSTSNTWAATTATMNTSTTATTHTLTSTTTTANNTVALGMFFFQTAATLTSYSGSWLGLGPVAQNRNVAGAGQSNIYEYQILPTSGTATGIGDVTVSSTSGLKGKIMFNEV